MTDPVRPGDQTLSVAGSTRRLRLSLAALAEIERALGVAGFEALSRRLAAPSACDLAAVLAALLRAGGAEDAEGLAAAAPPRAAAEAIAACFRENLS